MSHPGTCLPTGVHCTLSFGARVLSVLGKEPETSCTSQVLACPHVCIPLADAQGVSVVLALRLLICVLPCRHRLSTAQPSGSTLYWAGAKL